MDYRIVIKVVFNASFNDYLSRKQIARSVLVVVHLQDRNSHDITVYCF